VQQRAREEAQQEREEAERRKGAKKCVCAYLFRSASEFHFFFSYCRNVKLLSFGDDDGATEEAEPSTFKKRGIVRPDCAFYLNFR